MQRATCVEGARLLRRRPGRPAARRRRHRRDRRRPEASGADGRRRRRAGRAARPRRPAHAPARARPRGRRDGRDRHRAAALGGFTAVHAMANTDPVADTAGVVEQVWRLGREAGTATCSRSARSPSGSRASSSPSSARWPTPPPGCGSSPTTALRRRRGADAPGAGVRQGVRRRHRPARPGAPADRGRPDERGRAVRRARAARLAGGRRGGDHRPRRACSPRTSASRLHVCHVSTAGSVEILRWAKGKGVDVTAEVTPHHLLLTDELAATLRPDLQGQPAAAHRRRTSQALRAGAGRRHDRRRRHRPRAARRARTRTASGRPPRSDARPRDRAVGGRSETMVDTGLLDWAGVADRMSVRPAPDRPARPATAGRSRSARRPTSCSSTRRRAGRSTRPALASRQPQHAVRRAGAARPGRRDLPARPADGAGRQPRSSASDQRPRRRGRRVSRARCWCSRTAGPSAARRTARSGETFGEAVFTTGMTGYQETLTDPSLPPPGRRADRAAHRQHRGQRRGRRVAPDLGRRATWCATRPGVPSSAGGRARTLDDELAAQGVVGISGVDTRALTRHLRERGAMRVGVSSRPPAGPGAAGRVRSARRWPAPSWPRRCHRRAVRRASGGGASASPSPRWTSASRR